MMYDLVNEIQAKIQELEVSIKQLRKNGTEYAEAERDYKIAINKKAIELRSQDMPVTLINLAIYGYHDVAELRFKRDIAKVMYEANTEHINTTKLIIRILEAQLSREWGSNLSD